MIDPTDPHPPLPLLPPLMSTIISDSVAKMLKFYNIPLLTAGGFATEFVKPKNTTDNEYYMLTRTGYSYENIVKVINKTFEE